jgi:2-hydroxychromene-2-carboxylate isomerase
MTALWAEDRNIADEGVLRDICHDEGLDADALIAKASDAAIIAQYDAATEQAIAAGVFGSPFYIYKGQRLWGQDRLDFLAELVESDD